MLLSIKIEPTLAWWYKYMG